VQHVCNCCECGCKFVFGWIAASVLYAASISVTWAPGDVTSYVEFLKNLHLSSLIWFPIKATCAFPLVYHYINGIRHLVFILSAIAKCRLLLTGLVYCLSGENLWDLWNRYIQAVCLSCCPAKCF